LKFTRSDHGEPGQERQEKELDFGVMTKLTPSGWTYSHFNQLGGTQLELFNTQPELISTQHVILDRMEHSTTSPEEESLNNQDESLLTKHSGATDEVWYHGYEVS
jgi:hypothetical protein